MLVITNFGMPILRWLACRANDHSVHVYSATLAMLALFLWDSAHTWLCIIFRFSRWWYPIAFLECHLNRRWRQFQMSKLGVSKCWRSSTNSVRSATLELVPRKRTNASARLILWGLVREHYNIYQYLWFTSIELSHNQEPNDQTLSCHL